MASIWADAWEAAAYTFAELPRLERETRLYDETLRSTTVPGFVLESASATSSTLKSPTCLRLPGGELWAWEGCHDRSGCCAGSCTHVWNYQQALPYLFPALERGLRETEYANSLGPDGHMLFRMPLPLGEKGRHDSHAAADGQLGGVLKLYRDWRVSGDDAWLARLWPAAKASLEYAWCAWDRDRDGVMEGLQHNTYDIEFWGPNTLCGSFYLGALRAGERDCPAPRRLGIGGPLPHAVRPGARVDRHPPLERRVLRAARGSPRRRGRPVPPARGTTWGPASTLRGSRSTSTAADASPTSCSDSCSPRCSSWATSTTARTSTPRRLPSSGTTG